MGCRPPALRLGSSLRRGFYRSRIGELTGRLGEARDEASRRSSDAGARWAGRRRAATVSDVRRRTATGRARPARPQRRATACARRQTRRSSRGRAERKHSRGRRGCGAPRAAGRPASEKRQSAPARARSAGSPRHRRCGQRAGTVAPAIRRAPQSPNTPRRDRQNGSTVPRVRPASSSPTRRPPDDARPMIASADAGGGRRRPAYQASAQPSRRGSEPASSMPIPHRGG